MTEQASSRVELGLRLSLLTILLHPVGPFPIRPALLVLAGAAMLFPQLLRHPLLWGSLALLAGLRPILDWPLADNHAYLLAYWCLAVAVCASAADFEEQLLRASRWLLGLTFLFASLWKGFLSPDFLSGEFMRFIWFSDPRLEGAAMLLGGLDGPALEAGRAFLNDAPGAPDHLPGGERLLWASRLASLATVALEASVAVSLLIWKPAALRVLGHSALLVFCVVTYSFVTIEGFGWLLLSMGILLTERGWQRSAYLSVYALVLFLALVS